MKDGSWFDPTTWADGKVPGAGAKVLIPEAISVDYDSISDASVFTVRVDGKLIFAPDQNTRLVVDTLVVAKTGLLQIGTDQEPIQHGVTADIVIADNGPIDVTWDPLLLSRGVISHGTTEIHGEEKTSYLKLAVDPVAGGTLLYFDSEVAQSGWHVGDKIVITGTHIDPQLLNAQATSETQDEVRTIKAIYGSTVVLDQALNFSHDTPRADLKAYVADYTRNVVIETQNADNVPVSQRGHVMFMHSPAVDVEYAELDGLGRTDKSTRSVDAETAQGITSDTNVKGRYALHLHETGVEPGAPEAIVKGNAIWGSPGWGIVQHDSSADIENNATYGTFGAGYVAETGNETGVWSDNIAIGAHGIGAGPWFDKEQSDVEAFDLGRTGIGFYFQGRMIKATGNVAADVNEGFVYMVRGSPDQILADDLAQPEILHGLSSSDVAAAPIQNFTDNEVLAASYGLIVIKANPYQEHDVRSVIDGFKAWETNTGMNLQYTSHYSVVDSDFVGPTEASNAKGVELGANTYDIVLNGNSFSSMRDGILLDKDGSLNKGGDLGYVFIDTQMKGVTGTEIVNLDPNYDKVLSSSELTSGPATLQLNISWDHIPLWDFSYPTGPKVILTGTKTDSIGTTSYTIAGETIAIAEQQMSGLLSHQGYYTTDDGRHIVVLEEYYADRATGEIFKTSFPIHVADDALLPGPNWLVDGPAISLGKIDLNAASPVTHDDTATTLNGKAVVIDVLGNDADPSGLAMHIDGTTQPTHGSVTTNPDGTLTYIPEGSFTGVETFKYWATDQNAKFSQGIVTVHVDASDDSPGTDVPVVDTPANPPVDVPSDPPAVTPSGGTPGHSGHGGSNDHPHSWMGPGYHVKIHHQHHFDAESRSGTVPEVAQNGLNVADKVHKQLNTDLVSKMSFGGLSVSYEGSLAQESGRRSDPERAPPVADQSPERFDPHVQNNAPSIVDSGLHAARSSVRTDTVFDSDQDRFDFKKFEFLHSHEGHVDETVVLPAIEHHGTSASGFFF